MKSFIDKGHHFVLYTYSPDLGIPDGVEWRNADEILPFDEKMVYGPEAGEGQGSPALFANLFRYHLLAKHGGWWVDLDVYLLEPTVPEFEVFVAWESSGLLNNAVLRFPAGHSTVVEALRRAHQMGHNVPWGATGPFLLTELFTAYGLNEAAQPMSSAYPIHPFEAMDLLRPSRTFIVRERVRGSVFLHLWNEAFRRGGVDKTLRPPPGSLLRELFDKTGVDGWRGEYGAGTFDEHPNDGSIRIAGCTRRQRRWIVRLVKLLGCGAKVSSISGV